MLKISVVETPKQRRLIVEGALMGAWAAELKNVCQRSQGDGRELIVELRDLTAINDEGEMVLLDLMSDGIKIRHQGLFAKHVLDELARRRHTERLKVATTRSQIEIV